jgi:hypothetical protein
VSAAVVDYGTDIATFQGTGGTPDIDPMFTTVTGTMSIAQCVARRLITKHGWLFGSPNDCFDVRDWLNRRLQQRDLGVIQVLIQNEARKDERVLDCAAAVTYLTATNSLNITIRGNSSQGPFTLVLNAGQMTSALLNS